MLSRFVLPNHFLKGPHAYQPERSSGSAGFPWSFLALVWIILFCYQNPVNPFYADNFDLSQAVEFSRNGDPLHEALAILLGAIGILCLIRFGRGLRVVGTVGTLLLALGVWTSGSMLWSDAPTVTIRRILAITLMLCFCAGCVARIPNETLSVFIVGLSALNLFAATCQELIRGTFHPFEPGYRFCGTESPNTMAAGCSIAAIILFWRAWNSKGSSRLKHSGFAIAFMAFIMMTGSRTSILGLAMALLASAFLIELRRRKCDLRLIAAIVLLFCAGAGPAVLENNSNIGASLRSSIAEVLRTDRDIGEVSDFTGRNLVWDICIRYAAERPVLGYGFGGFWTGARLDNVADELKWPAFHAHSAYLDIFLGLGCPGILLFTGLLFGTITFCGSRYLRGDDRCGAWFAVFIFVSINGFTESIFVLPTFPEFVMCLILMRLSLRDDQQAYPIAI